MPKYHAHVFGKSEGCSKCTALKRRLTTLIESGYDDFDIVFHDILTEEGLADFLKSEVLNPNRVPGLLISKDGYPGYMKCALEEPYVFLTEATPGVVGIQTDYDSGGGLITPDMLKAVLEKARALG